MISEFALLIFATLGGVAVGLYVAATLIPVKEKKKMNLLITAIPLAPLRHRQMRAPGRPSPACAAAGRAA